ncbi:unnamed protein product [Caenorhabditis sp. 36 PRJEB53466]|nr:unnamed protein product [Caenorhabditis sp. 36 PRJEB53466]
MPQPSYRQSKVVQEKRRRDEINEKLETLRSLLQLKSKKQEDILCKVIGMLGGPELPPASPSAADHSSSGSIKKSLNDMKAERERKRRRRLIVANDALTTIIREKKLGTEQQRAKLERATVLDILIQHFEKPSPVTQPSIPLFPLFQPLLANPLLLNLLLNASQKPHDTSSEKLNEDESFIDIIN